MKQHTPIKALTLFAALLACAGGVILALDGASSDQRVQAREELVTLPERTRTTLTIYKEVDLTLVTEERAISFNAGTNRMQFSWANTLIDPSSVRLSFLSHADKLEILDTSFPAGENAALIWSITADEALSTTVSISYFTSGISWDASYQLQMD